MTCHTLRLLNGFQKKPYIRFWTKESEAAAPLRFRAIHKHFVGTASLTNPHGVRLASLPKDQWFICHSMELVEHRLAQQFRTQLAGCRYRIREDARHALAGTSVLGNSETSGVS